MRLPLIINETSDPSMAGDVFLFETVQAAEGYLEPVDVEQGRYVAYDAEGRLLRLGVGHARAPSGCLGLFRDFLRELRGPPRALSWVEVDLAEAQPTHARELQEVLTQHLSRIGNGDTNLAARSLSDLVALAQRRSVR